MNDTITAYRTCPLCEATCGLELTIEAGQVSRIRGDAQDVFSHGFVCPKGAALKPLHEDPDRVRTPLVRTATGFEEVSWDDALGEIERRLAPILERHGRDAVGRIPRQPERPQPRCAALRPGAAEGARHAQHLLRHHRGPDAQARLRRADVRRAAQHPDPRHGPHRLPADAGRQPAGLERQPADRARHARAPAGDPGARRARSSWSTRAAAARRRRPTSTTSSGPGRTRTCCSRSCTSCSRRGSRIPAPLAEHCAGLDEVRELAAGFAPEVVAEVCGIAAGEIRRMARELAAAETRRGLRADRDLHSGVRHAGELARRRVERR